MSLDSFGSTRGQGTPPVAVALATLRDLAGIHGSFVFRTDGQLVAREMHAMFDDDTLGEAAERLARLRDTFAAGGDELDLAVIRFQEHKLYLKVIPGGMLCILAIGLVNMAALRMAANLVGRRIAPEIGLAVPLSAERGVRPEPAVPSVVAEKATRSRPQVIAPGTRRFRGRAVE